MADPPARLDIVATRPSHRAFLGELIDTNILVNRFHLRQHGVDPDGVSIEYDPTYPGVSSYSPGTIVLGPRILALFERRSEYAYVLLAHELAHLTQPDPTAMRFMTAAGRPTRFHSRSAREQEAEFWEAQQAAKFGWGREEYEVFVAELHTLVDAPPRHARHFVIEERERLYAALPVLSRRPRSGAPTQPSDISPDVRVRRHRRRA